MSGNNFMGIVVLVGLPALVIVIRVVARRFLERDAADDHERETVGTV